MRFLALLTISIILSACTLSPTGTLSGSTQRYETHNDLLNSWVGKSEQDLVAYWGTPVKIQQNSERSKILLFRVQNSFIPMACVSAFELDQGKVIKWGTRGCPIRENKKEYKLVHKDTPVPQPTLDITNL